MLKAILTIQLPKAIKINREIYKKNEIFQRMRKSTINNVKTQIAKSLKNICSIYEHMTLLKQSEIQIEGIPKSLLKNLPD